MSRKQAEKPELAYKTLEGSCLCGAIHYTSDATPKNQSLLPAQLYSGTPAYWHSGLISVPSNSLSFSGKRPAVDEDQDVDGDTILRTFCPDCGTSLLMETDKAPFMVFIKETTLDQANASQSAPTMAAAC